MILLTIQYFVFVLAHRTPLTTDHGIRSEKMRTTLLFGALPHLALFAAGIKAFVNPHQSRIRSDSCGWHHNGVAVEASISNKGRDDGENRPTRPAARLAGYVDAAERDNMERALKSVGFFVLDDDATHDGDCFSYRWNAATGMLQLLRQTTSLLTSSSASPPKAEVDAPTWIPVVLGEESILVANGWSFLDADESEKLSPFDIDAANQEGLYRPKWGQHKHHDSASEPGKDPVWSSLGFDLTPPTEAQILEEAASLQNELSRRVLLEGGTDPAGVKQTHNGYSFSGSVQNVEPGIFSCAVGGLPLFSTADISPTTASSGWLSFASARGPLSTDHVAHIEPAPDADDRRVEVVCAKTGCHLGHYFGRADGYCINASALNFYSSKTRGAAANSGNDNGPRLFAAPVSYRRLETAELTPSIRLLREVIDAHVETSKVVLGGGCFWHVEYALRRLVGVVQTVVGYAGGTTPHPTYESVCNGQTGHGEVVQVEFDHTVLEPRILVDCFLAMHDPTKVRAHGKHAGGTGQYRSCIFLQTETIRDTEAIVLQALKDCQSQLEKELSTDVRVMRSDMSDWFWPAEERHQRHDERRSQCTADDLSTLSASEWLETYGRRSASIVGSSQTINSAVIET
jgi:peptide-methionine (S)-S-oxide reductase